MLVTLGARAELMTLFYPHIDHAQNLREGMPAVYFPDDSRGGRLVWTFEGEWRGSQRYLDHTNIVETRLHHGSGLELTITDLVPPTESVLVRQYAARNLGGERLRAKVFQYLGLQLGESLTKNAVHFHPDRGVGVAYWRSICLALGSDVVDEHGCGRVGTGNSAKRQMEQGRLNRQEDEIGAVDFALGWSLSLEPGETETRSLVIAADGDEPAAVARLNAARAVSWEEMVGLVRARDASYLARARRLRLDADLVEAYQRCLLALDLMVDGERGSVLAAPEFDPSYERSGGYGYCWPRDAIEVCLGLEAAGYPEYLRRFLRWAERCQRPEGYWEQRYWLGGQRAPSWCTHEDRLQIDQTAAVLFAMGRQARRLTGQDRVEFAEVMWPSARAAAEYLIGCISPSTGLHRPAFDLWETFRGSFTYSNAAISSALHEAAYLARAAEREAPAAQWEERAAAVKQAVMSWLWHGDSFARGIDLDGRLDTTADASILGLITPFEFLRLDRPEERAMAATLVDNLVRRLCRPVGGADALLRFEGDPYAGGGSGVVPTLWLVRALLGLALTDRENVAGGEACRKRAAASLRAVLSLGTPTGMLPEMTGPGPGQMWAVPHAWSMASFVLAAAMLDQLS